MLYLNRFMSTPYTESEIKEMIAYGLWQPPKARVSRAKHYVAGEETVPILPPWQYLTKRNLWTAHFAGLTCVLGPTLFGGQWQLYLEDLPVGEPGTLAEGQARGSGILLYAKTL